MTLILNGTDGISDVDGSAATPAVRGTDTNTGLFFPAADTIAFAEGGAEVARITNTGAWSFGASGTATGTNGQVLTSAGSGAAPTWANLPAGASLVRVARTSNTALTAANISNLIDITSGTFTQTFDACASLGNGWFCYLENSGTGNITLDPSGSETIDGLTSYIMYPGEVRLVQCDGTALRTIVLNAFAQTFTSSFTFIKPPGYSYFATELFGGGGGGGSGRKQSGSFNSGGSGGGGGGRLFGNIAFSAMPSSVTVTVGAGGTGGAGVTADGASNNGVSGGTTTFGSFFSVNGGAAGEGGRTNDGSTGGSGGNSLEPNNSGGAGGSDFTDQDGVAAATIFFGGAGGGGGGGGTSGTFRNGGAGGRRAAMSTAAVAAGGTGNGGSTPGGNGASGTIFGYGGGGGGSSINGQGGDGGAGGLAGGGGGGGYVYAFNLPAVRSGNGGNGGSGIVNMWGVI